MKLELTGYVFTLQHIGPGAAQAVPMLVKVMGDMEGDPTDALCDSLSVGAATNTFEYMDHPDRRACMGRELRRRSAAGALGAIHAQPDIAVPALAEAIRERP